MAGSLLYQPQDVQSGQGECPLACLVEKQQRIEAFLAWWSEQGELLPARRGGG
jgi:hypothetical protein